MGSNILPVSRLQGQNINQAYLTRMWPWESTEPLCDLASLSANISLSAKHKEYQDLMDCCED